MFEALRDVWYGYQRQIDLRILWPSCKRAAEERGLDLETAKAAFAVHAFRDRPWLWLGTEEIKRRIDALD